MKPRVLSFLSSPQRRDGRRLTAHLTLALGGILTLLAASEVAAATATWSGISSANWSDAGNWDVLPNATGDTLVFAGSSNLSTSNDLVTGVAGLTFDASAGAFTLAGNALSVSSGGSIVNNSSAAQSIGLAITNAGVTSVNAASGAIGFTGSVSGNSLAVSGGSVVTLGGATDNVGLGANVTNGTLVLAKTSSGTVHALGADLTIGAGGTLRLAGTGGDQIFYNQTVNLTDASAVFDLNGVSEAVGKLQGAGGTVLNNAASTTGTLTIGTGTNASNLSNILLANGAGTTALTTNAGGTFTLGSANTYTGITTIGGVVTAPVLASGGVASSIGASTSAAANLVISGGGTLKYTGASVTIDRSVTIGSSGGLIEVTSGATALVMAGVTTGGNTLTKSGAGSLEFTALVGGAGGAKVAVTGGSATLSGSTDNSFLGANVTGGTLVLNKASTGSIHALGSDATIASGGTLKLSGSGNDQIYFNSAVNMTGAGAVFDLNGKNEEIGKLQGAGGTVLNNATSTTSVLTIGGGTNACDFSNIVLANGTGTLAVTARNVSGVSYVFGSANTYTGVTTIGGISTVPVLANGGVASSIGASGSAAANLVVTGGGTLKYTGGSATIDRSMTIGSSGGILEVTSGTTALVVGGASVGGNTLTKSGAGSLEFTAAVGGTAGAKLTVTGGTATLSGAADDSFLAADVSNGTLVLNKASTGSIHALGGSVTVGTGGLLKLAGTGGDQMFYQSSVTLSATGATFDLNGRSEGLNGLTGVAGAIVTNNGTGASTLNLGNNGPTTTFAGTIQNGATGSIAVSISGLGSPNITFSGANTYSGDTTLGGSSVTFNLTSTGSLTFYPGASNVTNSLKGTGTASLDGTFNFNLTGAAIADGNAWQIIAPGLLSTTTIGANFQVPGFTKTGSDWIKVDGSKTWTFTPSTGVLWVAVTTAAGYDTWASTHGIAGEPATGDFDHDGVSNLMEYALGTSPTASTTAGSFSGGTVSFSKGSEAVAAGDVTWTLQKSTDLGATDPWTTVTPTVNNSTTISYALPTGLPKVFVRLIVTK
ncbi:hypothetical protein [Luteolibacter sp. LG18]|uniref:beta strand repeat-containing protein n=1 Tax=Luteolibacter sp. LG18 TaxID=2819286 RepID=UPI002B313244|nr:hypothetical protein llg_31120 [Luteolibacter sp. LG18]